MSKKQYFFSFVLAAISFIAARSLQKAGIAHYYTQKANLFEKEDGYFDVSHPEHQQYLPMGLQPFSHLSVLDSASFIGIISDSSALVRYNPATQEFSSFANWGQEALLTQLAYFDSTLVLLDDQNQVHLWSAPFDTMSLKTYALDNELLAGAAMCLHNETKRLFLLQQSHSDEDAFVHGTIYTFNLRQKQVSELPLFQFSTESIAEFVAEQQLSNTAEFEFEPIALAVHPKTNEIYMLSSKGQSIAVFSQSGQLVNFTQLDTRVLSNPCALAFRPNGNLLISNGDALRPSVIELKWNKLLQSKNSKVIFGR
ncbi:MAG: hypothetical protein RLZZ301_1345 [Bacteroidota bacterium]|jgi:hypothetical protein